MKTAVVILNWNTREYLERFLPPLIESVRGLDAGVIVADNASTDGSAETVSAHFPEARVLRFEENLGFTGGYNRAFGILLEEPDAPEYIVLINSDIEVVPGWLEPLTGWLDSHPECGICGPKLHALTREGDDFRKSSRFEYAGAAGGRIDRYGFPYCRGRVPGRTEEDFGQYDTPKEVFWVSGACLVTRASLWRRLGGLDGRFFAHMEEIDYCWRAQLEGFNVSVVPQSCVYHLGGGTLPQSSPFKLRLNYRNCLLMLEGNLAATIGEKPAARRMRTRMLIDFCAAVAYLLTGRFACFKAVVRAHREYREMRRPVSVTSGKAAVRTGPDNICIIPQAFFRGKKIFDYLRQYENSH